MKVFLGIMLAVGGLVATSGEAEASSRLQASAFQTPAMTSNELDGVRGGAPSPYALTVGAVKTMADAQARNDFAGMASVSRLVYDNWWNDVGSQIVVDNIALQ